MALRLLEPGLSLRPRGCSRVRSSSGRSVAGMALLASGSYSAHCSLKLCMSPLETRSGLCLPE
eukprot:scaffold108543_cov18-Phaeocystis_antarctica.AAC.1